MTPTKITTGERVLKVESRIEDLDDQIQEMRSDVDYVAGTAKAVQKLSDQIDVVLIETRSVSADVRDLKTRFDVELPNLARKSHLLEKINEHLQIFHRISAKGEKPQSWGYEVPKNLSGWLKIIIVVSTAIGTGLAAWFGMSSM